MSEQRKWRSFHGFKVIGTAPKGKRDIAENHLGCDELIHSSFSMKKSTRYVVLYKDYKQLGRCGGGPK